jgi:Na+/H+ antiporter NhaD/arsenite permease-like protein
MAVIGAVMMFVCRILTPAEALGSIDFGTLVLLFAMMLLVAGLHLAGFFDFLVHWIVRHLSPRQLMPGIIFSSGLLSAFLVNDVVCLIMAPLVLRVARQMRRPPLPLLLALATAANIGSAATITGNPQNILIGELSGIGYARFLARLGPIALVGLLIDWGILHLMSPRLSSPISTAGKPVDDQAYGAEESPATSRLAWPLFICGLVLAGFFLGARPPLAAAAGAALLLIGANVDRQRLMQEIDWSLLVLFTGLFLVLGGATQVGIGDDLLRIAERWNLQHGLALTAAVTVLSKIVSNVPAVMLLKGLVPSMADPVAKWLLLSMSSTLAGNLTITGSVANMIVVEKVRAEAPIDFWQYLKVGLPITAATLGFGLLWLNLVHY